MSRREPRLFLLLPLVACFTLALSSPAGAANSFWLTTSGTWTTPGNWTGGVLPDSTTDVWFGNVWGWHDYVVQLTGDQSVNSLTISNSTAYASNNYANYIGDNSATKLDMGYKITLASGNLTKTATAVGRTEIWTGLELGNNGVWDVSSKTGGYDSQYSQAYNIWLRGPITATGAYTLTKTGPGEFVYDNTTTPQVTRLTVAGGRFTWDYYAPAKDAVTVALPEITLQNGGQLWLVANPANSGSAGAIVYGDGNGTVTVDQTGGDLAADIRTYYTSLSVAQNIALNGPLTVGNFASGGQNAALTFHYSAWDFNNGGTYGTANPINVTGTVTVDQSAVGAKAIIARKGGSGAPVNIYGTIQDGAGSAGNPLLLKVVDGGTMTLYNPNNSYANGTIIDASPLGGQVVMSGTATLGTGNVTVMPGGKLRLASTANLGSGATVLAQASSLALGSVSMQANIMPSYYLDPSSSGVLAIRSDNYTQALDLSALGNGQMYLGSDNSPTGSGYGTSFNSTTLAPAADDVYRLGGNGGRLTLGRAILVDSGTARSVVVGSNKLNGTGDLRTNANQTYSGGTTVNVGSQISLATSGTSTPLGTGPIALKGARLGFEANPGWGSNSYTTLGDITYSSGNSIQLRSSGTNTMVVGGMTRANGGTLWFRDANNLGLATTGTTSGQQVVLSSTAGLTRIGGVVTNMVSKQGSNNYPTLQLFFVGYDEALGFTKLPYTASDLNAAGPTDIVMTHTLNNNTIITATLTDNREVLALTTDNIAMAGYNLQIDSGCLQFLMNQNGGPTISGLGGLVFGSVATPVEAFISTPEGNQNPNTISTPIIAAAGLTKFGPNVLLLNATSTFIGQVTVNEGILQVDRDAALGDPSNNVLLNGGVLMARTNSVATARTIAIGDSNGTIGTTGPGVTLTLNGTITGGGILHVAGNIFGAIGSSVVLNGPNNTTGGTIIRDLGQLTVGAGSSLGTGDVLVDSYGVLTLNGVANIADGALVTLGATGTMNVNGAGTETIGTLNGAGKVVLGSGATLALANDPTAFYGTTSGAGNLTKLSAATWEFKGSYGHTGNTTVAAGQLNLAGQLAGPVVVSGGALLPGGAAGGIGRAGGLGFAGSATNLILFNIVKSSTAANGGATLPGTDFNQLATTGAVDLTNGDLSVSIAPKKNYLGSVFTIITAGSAVSTSFRSVTFNNTGIADIAAGGDMGSGYVTLSNISYPGDANRDGITDMSDYIIWFNNFGQTSAPGVTNANWLKADFNGDGITDMTDYIAWFNYFGDDQSTFAVPEPATLALLALGLPLVLRKRR